MTRRLTRLGHGLGYLAAAVTGPFRTTALGRGVRAGWARHQGTRR